MSEVVQLIVANPHGIHRGADADWGFSIRGGSGMIGSASARLCNSSTTRRGIVRYVSDSV